MIPRHGARIRYALSDAMAWSEANSARSTSARRAMTKCDVDGDIRQIVENAAFVDCLPSGRGQNLPRRPSTSANSPPPITRRRDMPGEHWCGARGRKLGCGWVARCPVHDDRTPQASRSETRTTIRCWCAATPDATRSASLLRCDCAVCGPRMVRARVRARRAARPLSASPIKTTPGAARSRVAIWQSAKPA